MSVDEIAEMILQQVPGLDLSGFPAAASRGEVFLRFAIYNGDLVLYCFSENKVDESSELKGRVDKQFHIVPTTDLAGVVQAYEKMLIECGVKFIENPSDLGIANESLVGIRLKSNEDDPTFSRLFSVADKIARYVCLYLEESALEKYV